MSVRVEETEDNLGYFSSGTVHLGFWDCLSLAQCLSRQGSSTCLCLPGIINAHHPPLTAFVSAFWGSNSSLCAFKAGFLPGEPSPHSLIWVLYRKIKPSLTSSCVLAFCVRGFSQHGQKVFKGKRPICTPHAFSFSQQSRITVYIASILCHYNPEIILTQDVCLLYKVLRGFI